MSNTVITNYTDLNGPSSKSDGSVVVIVNKDRSLSVDQKLLGTLMGSDGSQTAGISVVRVGHEGRPDDATDSEDEDDKVPHVTLSVDSYYDEPNSIIKYDSGAEMLQSLRIETRENSLVGFHNDHCYTPLKSPSESISQINETYKGFDNPVIEITHTPPPKPHTTTPKKITVLEQKVIPKGKKIVINPSDAAVILKGNDILNKPLPVLTKGKHNTEVEKSTEIESKTDENTESSSVCSSGDSTADRDSDSDYKDVKDKPNTVKLRKTKTKPRILKTIPAKGMKLVPKIISRLKPSNKNITRKDNREKISNKALTTEKTEQETGSLHTKESQLSDAERPAHGCEQNKIVPRIIQKVVKKEKKTPAHVSALLTDMTSLFSTPDVIRRVSTDSKLPSKNEKDLGIGNKKVTNEAQEEKTSLDILKIPDNAEKAKMRPTKTYQKQKERSIPMDKSAKGYDPIPQLDDASLAQILQDTTSQTMKSQPSISTTSVINSPGLAGPLSPTLDLLGGLQPEEDGLTEDLLMHVAQLVESSENLQEVIDKQVLGKVDTTSVKAQISSQFQPQQQQPMAIQTEQLQHVPANLYSPNLVKTGKSVVVRKDPIEIVRRDGRIITLPPIEAPATRASKRKSQVETSVAVEPATSTPMSTHLTSTPEPPAMQFMARQYTNKKLINKKQEHPQQQLQEVQVPAIEKISAESQESWNSEDDPNRLWCICKQPHNNRFMICCDGCEDWFHGKCVNITKAMGQQMEEQGIEWRCPNCKGEKSKNLNKSLPLETVSALEPQQVQPTPPKESSLKTICIVCKKPARASSIYCSDACILKHAQDSLGSQTTQSRVNGSGGKTADKSQSDRVIVYERKSGRLLAGPNAPTAENLKAWLQRNPTFEVVRPGTLSTIKPNHTERDKLILKKKVLKASTEPNKIQTTLNFARIPRKSSEQVAPLIKSLTETKEKVIRPVISPKEDVKPPPQPKTPTTPKLQNKFFETPKASTSKAMSEPKKPARSVNRTQSASERAPSASPSTSRRKDTHQPKRMDSVEPIRDNVRKALQEQMSARMNERTESDGPRFTEDEIQQFANDTENELHELFGRDVGMKYKAKYRSLMFNIKDRKNLTLWEKICDRSISPKQLVRLSPEELASQELAQWRDKEAKHQLELIKKSELDLLAASKTYVLKTHKGEEVMENKESVSTELDPNVPVEDVVQALNEAVADEPPSNDKKSNNKTDSSNKKSGTKRKDRDSNSRHSKRGEYKREHEKRKSRTSRRRSEVKEKEDRSTRKSRKKSTRQRSESKSISKKEKSREKSVSREHRSRSRVESKRYSKENSRSNSVARERSPSSERLKRRSRSRESAKRSRRSRSQQRTSTDEKTKHRSKSQDPACNKSKNDSTDSDSVERPKSATLKEVHPEYDPHEPMITSAFSEEDLRKSREDVYDESYKSEALEFGDTAYEPSKSFAIDTNEILPSTPYVNKQDKVSEAESDQEPSSTVETSAATVWNGCINMVDVARFYVAAHEVSGNGIDLEEDLSTELDIVGRINPDTVWDYINKMKRASNKDIVILRLQAANDEEMMQYIALYSYLSSRNRLGVVKVTNTATVKDFYIVPLPANSALPPVLLPFDGPGLGDVRTHLLVAIIIRQRKKRAGPPIPKDIIPAKVGRVPRKRSYTPPVAGAGSSPPASPRRRLPLPSPYTSPALSSSIKDQIAATLATANDDEAYSPGSSSSSERATPAPAPPGNVLRTKMEELNRQIEEQKQQILKMARADTSIEEDEAYSPSRPMTPPPQPAPVPLADIALPSNLQEILATIKQRSENPTGDVDMRQMT